MSKATPRPWRSSVVSDYLIYSSEIDDYVATTMMPGIKDDERKANAELIVRAIDLHDDLIQAMKDYIKDVEDYNDLDRHYNVFSRLIKKARGV